MVLKDYFLRYGWGTAKVRRNLLKHLTTSMIEWTVIFRTSNVCQKINMLLRAFLEKLPGSCSIDVNQSSKYFKKTFCSQPNRSSLTEVKGARNGFLSNSCDWMLCTFIIPKKLSINKQNFAVPAASGGPYEVIPRLILHSWLSMESMLYVHMIVLAKYVIHILGLHRKYLQYGSMLYTFRDFTHNVYIYYFQNLTNNF